MNLIKKLVTLKLAYTDPNEEAEYDQITRPVLKDFLTYLLICVMIILIPLAVQLFLLHSYNKQAGMTIGMIALAGILFLTRKILSKWLEYIVIIYLILGVTLVVVNLNRVLLSFHTCEAFYAGYAFALFHRTLGYRIIKTSSMIVFHVVSLILRLVFLYDHSISVTLMAIAMEIFTLALSVKSEKGERSLFHSLYNSKQELLKFKDFLMEHLPNQMVIFTKDYNGACLTNTAFRQSFKCDDLYQLKCSLKTLIIEKESIQKNMTFFARLGFIPDKRAESISLSQFLWLTSKNFDLLRESRVISFDVFEDHSLSTEIPLQQTPDDEDFKIKIQRNDTDSPLTERKINKRTYTSLVGRDSGVYKEKFTFLKETHASHTERLFNTRNYSKELEGLPFSPGGRYSQEKSRVSNISDIKKRILKVKVFLLQWDGEEVIATMLDDVTQQKAVAETRLAEMNKELVIDMASREMTLPVNNILGLVEICKKKTVDYNIIPYLTACKNNSVLLLNFANSILDLARIRSEKLKLVYSKLSLKGLLMELTSIFQPFCQIKDLYFKTEMPANVPDIFITDKTRLYQILINLISSAIKATFEGGINLKIELDSHVPLRVRFTIQDTGLGIRKENQEKIFRIYSRSETTQADLNTEDNSIGLTISNILVSLLNSDGKGISIESEANQGCTFTFTLACKSRNSHDERRSLETSIGEIFSFSEEEDEGLPARNKEAPYMSMHGENVFTVRTYENVGKNKESRIDTKKSENYAGRSDILETKESKFEEDNKKPWCLIVDDDPYHLMVAKFYIEERGFRVKTALNGKEAISIAIEYHGAGKAFKLIIMDCQMPIMNGYDAAKALRKMMKAKKIAESPIFGYVEVNSEIDDEMSRKEAGMLGILTKPINELDVEHLLKRVSRGGSV